MDYLSLSFFNHVLFCVALYLILYNVYMLVFNKGVPNIRTAPGIRKKIIALLKADMAARNLPAYTIVDMGSGNGLLTRKIAAALPDAKVVGLEISKQSVAWANMMKKRQKLDNLEYICTDFNAYDFSNVSAVVVFLSIYEMGMMGKLLNEKLKPGTLITSNRFKLGDGWQVKEHFKVFTLYPFQKNLYLYEKR
ncbi:MAG: class I SAM-dependent methyltransferase [Micavibrio sp.]|nr:class I SAM-dependent methyltransferase [Micavibrio sp.]